MNELLMRQELYDFYLHGDAERSRAFAEKCFPIMDSRFRDGMSVTEQKLLQYDVICEEFEPIVFRYNPYFYETGVLTSLSDGAFTAKGHGFFQANGWVFGRNMHLFGEQDATLDRLEGLMRAISYSAVQSLQLNCISKEDLLDAQKHPEKYPNLIVRVTGFSAKFTSLSREWQDEVISRNFYD